MIKSTRVRWIGHVARIEKGGSAYILTEKSTGKTPLGRPQRGWEDIIKTDLIE